MSTTVIDCHVGAALLLLLSFLILHFSCKIIKIYSIYFVNWLSAFKQVGRLVVAHHSDLVIVIFHVSG